MSKYSNGARVRIKAGEGFRDPHSDTWQYENLTGEIVSSTAVAGYRIRSWERDANEPCQVAHAYKVHLDAGIEADNVIEECLEAWTPTRSPLCESEAVWNITDLLSQRVGVKA
ncbi:MAG: hypothetical protein A2147_07240 [Chloroflexi bacterium RBG_16_57_8]|nr:MAG: hypothetical protein A2147_07240 [Chloroflexi bacterium RBG_16_57_8]